MITWRANGIVDNGLVDGLLNDIGVLLVAQMVQHIDTGTDHGHRVGDILAGNGGSGVTGARLKDGVLKLYDKTERLWVKQKRKRLTWSP